MKQMSNRNFVARRGFQLRRKDKDLMRDTGGISKMRRYREPYFKPPRDDNKNVFRWKNLTDEEKKDWNDVQKEKISKIVDMLVANVDKNVVKRLLSQMPLSLYAAILKYV